ncbi:MAG: competence protein ComK [Pisciglobus halotolerans]|nr:competence protein ComK [Pisciglobus halotolerans]
MKDFYTDEFNRYNSQLKKECHIVSEEKENSSYAYSDYSSFIERDGTYRANDTLLHSVPLTFSSSQLQDILDNSIEHHYTHINENTFYILDLSKNKQTSFNSLVFQLNQPPIKSMEPTNKIMTRYFDETHVSYSFIQSVGKAFGIHKCCPYVCGDEIFIPEKGAGNNKSASWIAMHHILHYNVNKKEGQVYLYFRNHHQMMATISPETFRDQLKRSATLYHAQSLMVTHFLNSTKYIRNDNSTNESNIIQKKLTSFAPDFKPYSLHRLLQYFVYFSAQELLVKIMKKDNPYLDDLNALSKVPELNFIDKPD